MHVDIVVDLLLWFLTQCGIWCRHLNCFIRRYHWWRSEWVTVIYHWMHTRKCGTSAMLRCCLCRHKAASRARVLQARRSELSHLRNDLTWVLMCFVWSCSAKLAVVPFGTVYISVFSPIFAMPANELLASPFGTTLFLTETVFDLWSGTNEMIISAYACCSG